MNQWSFPFFVALWNRLQNQTTPYVHFVIAGFLEKSWERGERKLLLMAFRACGKSTLVGLFCVWLLWRAPDLRILVLSADLALARKMVRNVKRILEKHPLTSHLKPADVDQWGSDRFTIKREKELRDPSMLAKGVLSNLTGTRADVIICDDVEVPKTSNSFLKREALRERLLELDYILTPDGTQLYVGTPHCYHSIYSDVVREGEADIFLKSFSRLVMPIVNEMGESVWPERYSLERIDEIRKRTGPAHFKSQMLCEPARITDGYFSSELLKAYEAEIIYREAGGQPVMVLEGKKIVASMAWWDPAFGLDRGDRSVLAVVFTDEDGRYYLHHVQQMKVRAGAGADEATQQCRQVVDVVRDYHLPNVHVEINGLGRFLPSILRNELSMAGLSCSVQEETARVAKAERILTVFDAPLAAEMISVHRRVMKTPFLRELEEWGPEGGSGHDDYLDAVAGALSASPVRIRRIFKHGQSYKVRT